MRKVIILMAMACLAASPLIAANQPRSNGRNGQSQAPSQGKIQWYTNYNQAVQTAQQQNKPILLFFTGSDWCGWCKKMQNEIFSSPDFAREVGNSFVFVEVDFPMSKTLPPDMQQQNAALQKRFSITGYPTVIILDPQQNVLGQSGYMPGGGKAYADFLKQFLQRS